MKPSQQRLRARSAIFSLQQIPGAQPECPADEPTYRGLQALHSSMPEPAQSWIDPERFASLKVRPQQERSGSCARAESRSDESWAVPAEAQPEVEEERV